MSCNMRGGVRLNTLALMDPPNLKDMHTPKTPLTLAHTLPYIWLTPWFAFKRRLIDRWSYKPAWWVASCSITKVSTVCPGDKGAHLVLVYRTCVKARAHMCDEACLGQDKKRFSVTLVIYIWLLLHSLTLAAHGALIKPMRSHTCVATWLEFPRCHHSLQRVQAFLIAFNLYHSWCEKVSYPLLPACNDVLRLGLYS